METWTPADFRAWLERMGLTHQRAADELGITKRMALMYAKGEHSSRTGRKGKPLPVEIPRKIMLACIALETGPMSILRRASRARP
jgi:hypothetical protein